MVEISLNFELVERILTGKKVLKKNPLKKSENNVTLHYTYCNIFFIK